MIIAAAAAVVVGGTTAYFSDEEISTGNTFTAGSIDLLVDSECTYNGVSSDQCGTWGQNENGIDITNEKFFDFSDLKPGDSGENTISLHIDNNDAWLCAQIEITSDEDVTCTDPENVAEGYDCIENTTSDFNGEIAENLSLAWWADDGDNVLQADEMDSLFFQSGLYLDDILSSVSADNKVLSLTLADSLQNFFPELHIDGRPLNGAQTYFVGLAWCFGEMDIAGDASMTCDGLPVDNDAQSDQLTADIAFSAVQYRNNEDFRCEDSFKE